ncbi:MAG: transglycosylase SLT domain-containing protein [Muribaculaceae bacterium]|nr:transglycosylase SLT domain-containing protein [Muribaculaceae bacterium]
MNRSLIIFALAAASFGMSAFAKQPANVLDLKESITDDSIIFPESFETDTRKMLESWYLKNYTDTDDRYRTSANPSTSDATMRQRLADLPTVIDMPYNQIVRSYIDRYMEKGRPMVASLLGLSTYYMPIFEQALEAEQLPQELKYLPVIESALNPNAVSRSGAGGLWQFMPAAAKGYDLEVSSLVDERRDPYKSSKKAAKMLHDLYDTYGDWSLAIAAYNCGPGNVNKAIRRAGGDPKKQDFWSIYKYLSPETRGYVPMFIAANYVMNYYKEHNISPVLPTRPLVTDTVGISTRVHFDQISKVLDIPKDELRILNPQFRADIIPGSASRQYMLILPSQQAQAYIMSEPEILAYEAAKYARRTDANPGDQYLDEAPENDENPLLAQSPNNTDELVAEEIDESPALPARQSSSMQSGTRKVTHTVSGNENINDIAERYSVRVADIRAWNSLRRNAVRPGQTLTIHTSVPESALRPSTNKSAAKSAAPAVAAAPASTAKTAKSNKAAEQPAAKKSKKQTQTAEKTTTASSSKKSSKKQQSAAAQPSNHEIKSGESLSTIARKHGVTVDELKKANNLKGDNIRAGESLKVPSKGGAKASKTSKSGKGAKTAANKSQTKSSKKSKKKK